MRTITIVVGFLLLSTILVANSRLKRQVNPNALTKEQYSQIAKMVRLQLMQIQINKFKAAGIRPADLLKEASFHTPHSRRKTHAALSIRPKTMSERTKTRRFGIKEAREGTNSVSRKPRTHTPRTKSFDIKGASLYFSFVPAQKPAKTKTSWSFFGIGLSISSLFGAGNIPLPVVFKKGTKLELKLGRPGVDNLQYIVDRKELIPSFLIPPAQVDQLPTKEFSGAQIVLNLLDGTKLESDFGVNLEQDAFEVEFIRGEEGERNFMDVYILHLEGNKLTSIERLRPEWRSYVEKFWTGDGENGNQAIQEILKDLERDGGNREDGNQNFDQLNWDDIEKLK